MGTQGMVSLVWDGHVVVKAVCGCDGYRAEALARDIIAHGISTAPMVYDAARKVGFGCVDCLTVLDGRSAIFYGARPEPPDRYFETLQDPQFNPRWEQGAVGELFILPAPEQEEPSRGR